MDYRQMEQALQIYNWDDGFEFPQTLLDHPLCDLALALQIFDLGDGYSYMIGAFCSSGEDEWTSFIRPLYEDILAGKYPKTDTLYKAPYTKEQKLSLKKDGIPDVFLTDLP